MILLAAPVCSVTKAENGKEFNGAQVWSVGHVTNGRTCELTMLSIDLATTPEVAGQQLYLAVQVLPSATHHYSSY